MPLAQVRPEVERFPQYVKNWYPMDMNHILCQENRICGFVNASSWIEYLGERDLFVGTRIYGTIASMLAGTPAMTIATDLITQEACEYHNLPFVTEKQIRADMRLEDLIASYDFDQVLDGHAHRMDRFLTFLHKNGLRTIYDDELAVIPFDTKLMPIDFTGPVVPFAYETTDDQIDSIRLRRYYEQLADDRLKDASPVFGRWRRALKKLHLD